MASPPPSSTPPTPPTPAVLRTRTRAAYPYTLAYRTRWTDNDMYDHMNNSVYNHLFDSVINSYLATACGLHAPSAPVYGLVVASATDYFAPVAFPAVLDLCLRVQRLGGSSVQYEVAMFAQGEEGVKAVGRVVHVFVDRATGRPVVGGVGGELREGLERLVVKEESKL